MPEPEEEPLITDLDELQTFVGSKRHKVWLWTGVNHRRSGIIAWTIGDRSSLTFQLLWTNGTRVKVKSLTDKGLIK